METSNIIRNVVTISSLRIGDTVEVEGELITVSKRNFFYDKFMGYCFNGSSYPKEVTKVIFKVPLGKGGFRYE
jgi:hypothetical protein